MKLSRSGGFLAATLVFAGCAQCATVIETKPPRRSSIAVISTDRGCGDSPKSSDGVVPYWSSHLPSAHSEKVVPSHHSAHQHPDTVAEVKRILT